jgi:hypothetical protein
MSRFLKRIASALFGRTSVPAELATPVTSNEAFAPIDSNVANVDWFAGRTATPRDSIDSDPDTARWYRRPRYVVPGAAVHRTSGSFGGG